MLTFTRGYASRCLKASGIVGALMTMGFLGLPELRVSNIVHKKEQIVLQVDDIPETSVFVSLDCFFVYLFRACR